MQPTLGCRIFGDNFSLVTLIYLHLVSGGTDSYCSGLFFKVSPPHTLKEKKTESWSLEDSSQWEESLLMGDFPRRAADHTPFIPLCMKEK